MIEIRRLLLYWSVKTCVSEPEGVKEAVKATGEMRPQPDTWEIMVSLNG
jgi:hypothetical protein